MLLDGVRGKLKKTGRLAVYPHCRSGYNFTSRFCCSTEITKITRQRFASSVSCPSFCAVFPYIMDEEKGCLLNFTPPFKSQGFDGKLDQVKVALDDVEVRNFSVKGTVKVRNMGYHKKITIRYSIDDWSSYQDVVGWYINESHTDFTDTFGFEFSLPDTKERKLEFAICFSVHGVEFWDNNNGENYQIMFPSPSLCVSHSVPLSLWKLLADSVLYILEKIGLLDFNIHQWISKSFITNVIEKLKSADPNFSVGVTYEQKQR